MYDHNQTLVPDSFLALHARHGRPLLARSEMEARFEACEDVALHLAAALAERGVDVGKSAAALRSARDGLTAGGAFSPDEAQWTVGRVAELMEWPQPLEPAGEG